MRCSAHEHADNVGYGLRMRGIAKPELKASVAEGALS
jgi:hypothetical protein